MRASCVSRTGPRTASRPSTKVPGELARQVGVLDDPGVQLLHPLERVVSSVASRPYSSMLTSELFVGCKHKSSGG